MSPQRRLGASPTELDDIYSLGITLYSLATGFDPHVLPDQDRIAEILVNVLNPYLPARFSELVMKCIKVNCDERPQSAQQVMRTLKEISAQLGGTQDV